MEDTLLKFLEQELEEKQYAVRELERLWHTAFKQLNDLDDAEDILEEHYYEKARQLILDEMTSYRKVIRRNKIIIEKLNIRIKALKK